jgi:hypothetical protein
VGHPKVTYINEHIKVTHKCEPTKAKKDSDKSLSTRNGKIVFLENVYLTHEEHQNLINLLGEEKAKDFINRLNDYIHQIGRHQANAKYKSHYHVILNWHRRDASEIERRLKVAETIQQKKEEKYF